MNMAFQQTSSSEDSICSEPDQAMSEQIQEVMAQKAVELFRVCDKGKKGYITRSDMQRLRAELPVSPNQLEVVFDSLDSDNNGYITLQSFTEGFGSFLGLSLQGSSQDEVVDESEISELYECQAGETDPLLEDKMFYDMMWQIGAANVFQDEDVIKAMWLKLHREELDMATAFEEFIARLAGDINRSKVDFQSLEAALMSKHNEHEEEVRKLYEEMELQIKQEQEKILIQEKAKEKQMRGELEAQLKEKEKQLQDILTRHQELEQKMSSLNKVETITKHTNERLLKEKDQLEALLSQSQENLELSRTYIQHIQLQQKDEKREKARAAQMLSEGIALERESLMKQLNLLRDINKRLRDDKDEADTTEARFRKSRETNRSNSTPVQDRSYISKIQYYPTTNPVDGKGQMSVSQST